MIIGDGLIGGRFSALSHDGVLIFASGVSNSKSSCSEDYAREISLVKKALTKYKGHLFIYFSTYSIDDPDLRDTHYVLHKQKVEEIISNSGGSYLIIRTSNIVGRNLYNPHTVLNFLYTKIKNEEAFECWSNAERNLLDIDHLYEMVQLVLASGIKNQVVYLVNPVCYTVPTIIQVFSSLLNKNPVFVSLPKGARFSFDTALSKRLFSKLNIDTRAYLEDIIIKYYVDGN